MLIMDSGLINKNISNNYQRSEVPGTPYKKRGTEWNFVPLALRRLLPDLRAKLACSARSDNALRSGAMLAHEENSNVPLILYGVPGTSAVLAIIQ